MSEESEKMIQHAQEGIQKWVEWNVENRPKWKERAVNMTIKQKILNFLKTNPGKQFSAWSIAKAIGENYGSVGGQLCKIRNLIPEMKYKKYQDGRMGFVVKYWMQEER